MGQKYLSIGSVLILVFAGTTYGDLNQMQPFSGDAFENFSSLSSNPPHVGSVEVFNGDVTVTNLTDGGSIFVAQGSSLGGDLVTAYSPPLAIAQLGISEWVFAEPIVRFGAYFENNSRFDDAVLEFYDADGDLIGTDTASVPEDGQQWVWNGWDSGTPIHRIVCTGNDELFLNGFIWFDDVEISFPSQPGDVNRDGATDLNDVAPFVDRLVSGSYQVEADLNQNGDVDLLDVHLFVNAIQG